MVVLQEIQSYIVAYRFIHSNANNLLKCFTANWKEGNRPVVHYDLHIIFYELVLHLHFSSWFLKMIANDSLN